MAKTAVIEISLVKESADVLNVNLEKELQEYLEQFPSKLPWQDEVKKVVIK
jgi:hypothetical protein